MALIKRLSPLVLASFATARQCSTLQIPVTIDSRQGQFREIPVETNLDVGAFAIRFSEFQGNYSDALLEDYQTLSGSYEVSAKYCRPDNGSSGTIQVLTHGIGFDKTYWDLPYQNYNYSYVNSALDAGYSTLAIDRLGVGNSTHGDPINEIQAQAEVEALNAVTLKLRSGEISEIDTVYDTVIHVGHSFGSVQSYWLSALYPNNTDGLILTGYSTAAQFLPYVIAGWNLHSARLNQPLRLGNASNAGLLALASQYGMNIDLVSGLQKVLDAAGVDLTSAEIGDIVTSTEILDLITGYNESVFQYNYPSGYMASSDLTSLQYAFLYPDNYDLELAIMGEQTKQPVTVGEILTIGNAPAMSSYTGPVFVITGEHDIPFCGGNCFGQVANSTAANIPAGVEMAFPSASAFDAYVQPGAGHGLNFQYNATAGYQVIQDWLASNGLGA